MKEAWNNTALLCAICGTKKNRQWTRPAKCLRAYFGNVSPAFTDGNPTYYCGILLHVCNSCAHTCHLLRYISFLITSSASCFASWCSQIQQNRSFAKPHESTLWENWVIATMAITRGKCIVPHPSPMSLLRVGSFFYLMFPVQTTWVLYSCLFTTRFWP
jgi:hypothetical protein